MTPDGSRSPQEGGGSRRWPFAKPDIDGAMTDYAPC